MAETNGGLLLLIGFSIGAVCYGEISPEYFLSFVMLMLVQLLDNSPE